MFKKESALPIYFYNFHNSQSDTGSTLKRTAGRAVEKKVNLTVLKYLDFPT
jgi:hypothetical protein